MLTVALEVQNIVPGNETVGEEVKDGHIEISSVLREAV